MTIPAGVGLRCAKCGTELAPALLSCPQCRQLVHADALKRLAAEAEQAEAAGDLATASSRWQDALQLLPHDARQAQVIAAKVEALGGKLLASPAKKAEPHRPAWLKGGGILVAAALLVWKLKFVFVFLLTKGKLLLLGLTKMSTLTSMLLAFGVYWTAWGWAFAAGLIVSMYIHEMGHVAWLARYGIKASAPMFIPGLGAVVRMKQYPHNVGIDARIGLAGPLWGLGAAVVAWVIWQATGVPMWGAIAKVGAWLNLFNLLPLGTLDGGRAFRALDRRDRFIGAGIIGAAWYVSAEPLLVLLLIVALFRAFTAPPETTDKRILAWYGAMVALLTLLSKLNVDPGSALR